MFTSSDAFPPSFDVASPVTDFPLRASAPGAVSFFASDLSQGGFPAPLDAADVAAVGAEAAAGAPVGEAADGDAAVGAEAADVEPDRVRAAGGVPAGEGVDGGAAVGAEAADVEPDREGATGRVPTGEGADGVGPDAPVEGDAAAGRAPGPDLAGPLSPGVDGVAVVPVAVAPMGAVEAGAPGAVFGASAGSEAEAEVDAAAAPAFFAPDFSSVALGAPEPAGFDEGSDAVSDASGDPDAGVEVPGPLSCPSSVAPFRLPPRVARAILSSESPAPCDDTRQVQD